MAICKKTIVFLYLFLFIFLLFAVEAAGAVEFTMLPDRETASPGDDVTFSLRISGNTGILALTLDIGFDEDRLIFTGFEDSEFKDWSVTAYKAAWVGKQASDFNGNILLLKYHVKTDAPEGEAAVKIFVDEGDAANALAQSVPAAVNFSPVIITSGGEDPQKPDHPWPFPKPEDDVLPGTGFSAIHPLILSEKPLDLNYKPIQKTLEIPSISVNAEILTVPFKNGEYPISWLGSSIGMLEGSALPGRGYTVLTGHNHLNNMEAGPFALLGSLKDDDRIFVRDIYGNLQTFVVYANEKVSQNNIAAVERIAVMFDNSITMITCEDELPDGGYANRRIVAAKPFGK